MCLDVGLGGKSRVKGKNIYLDLCCLIYREMKIEEKKKFIYIYIYIFILYKRKVILPNAKCTIACGCFGLVTTRENY